MKTIKQLREEAVAGAAPATSVSGGGIAGIRPDEIPPVGKGITTKGHMLRRKKPIENFSKIYGNKK